MGVNFVQELMSLAMARPREMCCDEATDGMDSRVAKGIKVEENGFSE
jgi:hypothetical protein